MTNYSKAERRRLNSGAVLSVSQLGNSTLGLSTLPHLVRTVPLSTIGQPLKYNQSLLLIPTPLDLTRFSTPSWFIVGRQTRSDHAVWHGFANSGIRLVQNRFTNLFGFIDVLWTMCGRAVNTVEGWSRMYLAKKRRGKKETD